MDFMNYFDRMEHAMQERFDAMNAHFERAMSDMRSNTTPTDGSQYYTKTVTRSYNGEGNCGEETIVERDSRQNKEVKTVSRHLGERSIQHVESKDLASGAVEHTIRRNKMTAEDDEAFNQDWKKAETRFLPAARRLLHDGHGHQHAAAAQLEDRKK